MNESINVGRGTELANLEQNAKSAINTALDVIFSENIGGNLFTSEERLFVPEREAKQVTTTDAGIIGGQDADNIGGTESGDTIYGAQGNDTINGAGGNDTIYAGKGDDLVDGGAGDDAILRGDLGNDTVTGGSGNDTIFGGKDNDSLNGGEGNNILSGDNGNDTLTGGAGDTLTGGEGDDIFKLVIGDGITRITDMALGNNKIMLPDGVELGDQFADQKVAGKAYVSGSQISIADSNGQLKPFAFTEDFSALPNNFA